MPSCDSPEKKYRALNFMGSFHCIVAAMLQMVLCKICLVIYIIYLFVDFVDQIFKYPSAE